MSSLIMITWCSIHIVPMMWTTQLTLDQVYVSLDAGSSTEQVPWKEKLLNHCQRDNGKYVEPSKCNVIKMCLYKDTQEGFI